MARQKTIPGTWGEIGFKQLKDGRVQGRVWYRTLSGIRKDTTATGKTKAAVERLLKAKLPRLVASSSAPDGDAPRTFAETSAK